MPTTRSSGTKHTVVTPDDNDAFDENTPPNHQGKRLKRSSGVGNAPDAVIAKDPPLADVATSVHAAVHAASGTTTVASILLAEIQQTQQDSIRQLQVYAKLRGSSLAPFLRTKATSRASIEIACYLSFTPDRRDNMTPCLDTVMGLFKLVLFNLYNHDEIAALQFVNESIIFFNRTPLILPWNCDSTHPKAMDKILQNTDGPMHKILSSVTDGLQLKASLLFGERAADFSLKFQDIMPDDIRFQHDILCHPENWTMRRLSPIQRRVILDSVSKVVAKVLNLPEKIIPECDAHNYLHAYSMESCLKIWRSKARYYSQSPAEMHAEYMLKRVSP
jgi:hypothetical protein